QLNVAMSSGPIITKVQWGSILVSGKDRPYKDAKVWPTGSRAWDWSETGTSHNPGVQPTDLDELFDKSHYLDALVISCGMELVLQVPESTVLYAKERCAQVFVLQTEEAVFKYNELVREGQRVAGLFHSTC
ncbi:hypothetical protein BOX15_Mlig008732g1, partial [Macrostomum lignano]